jgi:hypothetical protein
MAYCLTANLNSTMLGYTVPISMHGLFGSCNIIVSSGIASSTGIAAPLVSISGIVAPLEPTSGTVLFVVA